jgi:hypothetical protein
VAATIGLVFRICVWKKNESIDDGALFHGDRWRPDKLSNASEIPFFPEINPEKIQNFGYNQ